LLVSITWDELPDYFVTGSSNSASIKALIIGQAGQNRKDKRVTNGSNGSGDSRSMLGLSISGPEKSNEYKLGAGKAAPPRG
jgi:hypothetical protein